MDEEAIFHQARRILDSDARRLYLDQACAARAPLRARLEALLQVHDQESGYLEPKHEAIIGTIDHSRLDERTGTLIGPYKLLQEIGEGGMGSVFMAEQQEPVQRKVALKLIKPGMDSHHVIARFEAERQALALMDHPNIARVLDAGTTDSGRPYFVMELVKGVPITKYCDERRLTPNERLELFIGVCQAVQHAAPERHHPSRSQAVQRADRPVRRQAGAQGDRLRHRQGDRSEADGADPVHGVRSSGRHAGIYVARTGGVEPARYRHAQRHLLAGRAALRTADRHDTAGPKAAHEGGAAGIVADHPRGRAGEAEHAPEYDGGIAEHRGQSRSGSEEAERASTW